MVFPHRISSHIIQFPGVTSSLEHGKEFRLKQVMELVVVKKAMERQGMINHGASQLKEN